MTSRLNPDFDRARNKRSKKPTLPVESDLGNILDMPFSARLTGKLQPHSPTPGLEISYWFEPSLQHLHLAFALVGPATSKIKNLDRRVGEGQRRDELWKSTCFELFFAQVGHDSYMELNVDPLGNWNLYSFDRYRLRSGQIPQLQRAPEVTLTNPTPSRFDIEIRATLSQDCPLLRGPQDLVFQPTCVIEMESGGLSYWAPFHLSQQPDFHARHQGWIRT